jgi:HEPN/Toprim N-terminal domain 1
MGSYCSLYVAGQNLGSTKNGIDPSVMLLFRATDRCEVVLCPGTPEYLAYFRMPEPGDTWAPSQQRQVVYRTTCGVVKERLNLLGFTRDASSRAFRLAVERELATFSADDQMWQERIAVFNELTPERWLEGVNEILSTGCDKVDRFSPEYASLSPLLRHILGGWTEEWMGCPARDVRHVIRLFVELVDPDDEVLYDLTDLVAGGWLDNEADLIEYAEDILRGEAAAAQRVIVLTEGATDKGMIEGSMRLLTPHLADYFTFMDFEGARVAGGSGAMAHTVKAFVGAGILNRVVAIFDNDTAAAEALAALTSVKLPDNFAVLQYPDLSLLQSYPTLGPTGVVRANVNGVAASIELYLGEDVLRGEDGSLTPVHWKGFNERINRYQGVILDKSSVLKRFEVKLRRCVAQPAAITEYDWSGMYSLIDALCAAAGMTATRDIMHLEQLDL